MVKRSTETTYKTIKGKSVGRRRTGILVPEAKNALDSLKHSVASDMGIDFTIDDKGNFTAKDCGRVGGEMVRRIINQMKLQMAESEYKRYQ